jgi:hypothetical protein
MSNRLWWAVPGIAVVMLGLVLAKRNAGQPPESAPFTSPAAAEILPIAPLPPPELPAPEPEIVYVTNQFHWSQLESADYREYIANLRAIGCPEPTIRDIILTDVMKLYAARRGQVRTGGREFKYWETNEKRILKARDEAHYHRQMETIDQELPGVVRELIGVNYDREVNKLFVDTNADAERLGFLADEKKDRLLSLREQYEGLQERIYENALDGELSPEDFDRLQNLQRAQKDELARLLTPDEFEQYELRTSPLSERLRNDLIGFEPTEEEFRTIFRAYRELDEKYAGAHPHDVATQARKLEDQQRLESLLKEELGPDRSAHFEQVQVPEYRTFAKLAERHELDPALARGMLDAKFIAETERERLLHQTSFLPEQREVALEILRQETENYFREELGEAAFQEYRHGPGAAWFQSLGR